MTDQVYRDFIDSKVRQMVDRLLKSGQVTRKAVLEEAAVIFPQWDVAPCDVVHVVRKEFERRGVEHQL